MTYAAFKNAVMKKISEAGYKQVSTVIELRMFEMKLKQKDLAEILETSTSRISEYLNGKRDITIQIARAL